MNGLRSVGGEAGRPLIQCVGDVARVAAALIWK